LQAFLGFPAQLANCPTAVISGAAPVNVTLTLDENETKVKGFVWGAQPFLKVILCKLKPALFQLHIRYLFAIMALTGHHLVPVLCED
jgi:hypothetical protein